jgi:hypothetical protein
VSKKDLNRRASQGANASSSPFTQTIRVGRLALFLFNFYELFFDCSVSIKLITTEF